MTVVDWMFEHPYLATILGIFVSLGIGSFRIVGITYRYNCKGKGE